jgi:hypothetical protein
LKALDVRDETFVEWCAAQRIAIGNFFGFPLVQFSTPRGLELERSAVIAAEDEFLALRSSARGRR